MRTGLNLDDLGDLLELPILAVLATKRKNGTILLSPVWHEWSEGGFSIVTWANDIKSKNIRANPQVTVLVAEAVHPYRSLEISGTATLEALTDPMPFVTRLGTRFRGADGAAYVEQYRGLDMELVRVKPGTVRAWVFAT